MAVSFRPAASLACLVLLVLASRVPVAAQPATQSPVPGPAQGRPPSAVLLLDGSGSMWGPLAPRLSKLDATRSTLREMLPRLRQSLQLGVVAFGHRRSGDCTDVELVAPVARIDEAQLTEFLRKLNPRGRGPIGSGLKQAAEAFGDKARDATIVVVTDNKDNCSVDACATAREVKSAHPGLRAHVVALNVPDNEIAEVACIAANTGGRLFRVGSQQELASALDESFRLTAVRPAGVVGVPTPKTAPPPPAPPKAAPAVKLPPGLKLAALLGPGAAVEEGVRWRVVADGRPNDRPVYEGEEPSPDLKLPPGRYVVEAALGLVQAKQTFDVTAAGPTAANVLLNAGTVRLRAVQTRGGQPLEQAFYTIYAREADPQKPVRTVAISREATPLYHLPAGNYLVMIQHGTAKIERSLSIQPGTRADVEMVLDMGELALTAVAREGGDTLDSVTFLVFEDDPDAPQGRREVARSAAPRPDFMLPAGNYHVHARRGPVEVRDQITVKPGSRTERALVLGSGRLTLATRLPGKAAALADQVSYRIERLDGSGAGAREVARTFRPAWTVDLAQGRYRVESRVGSANAQASREIEVKPGSSQSVTLEVGAGIVRLRFAEGAALGLADLLWELKDRGGQIIHRTAQPDPRLALTAGRYTVVLQVRDKRIERSFDVAAGDDNLVELQGE